MLSRTEQQASLLANTQTNKDPTPGGEGAWSPVQRPGENEGSRAHMGLSDDAKLATGSLSQATPGEGAGEKPEREMETEDGQEVNEMPEVAAQVFSPSVQIVTPPCSLRKRKEAEAYEIEEAHPFLAPQKEPLHGLYEDWPEGADSLPHQKPSGCCGGRCDCCSYSSLKATASLAGALLIAPLLLYGGFVFLPFDAPILSGAPSAVIYTLRCAAGALLIAPLLLYGGFVFLPFDAPILSGAPSAVIYTLRCAAFATVPIVLGIAVHGISQLCSSSLDPFGDRKQEVEVHRRFVNQSVSLLVLFVLNLAVLSTYLDSKTLKLVPLLSGLFGLARLIYWLAFAIGSNFRSFGFGLTYFPIVAMLGANIFFMFVQQGGGLFATEAVTTTPSPPKQRFWG
ncbi:Transmembrane protein 79 [Acipenser ruthenus]|uniref:Transmembrane protein 79 n=1 Tax=Acipenser ruthenus TaxID=7906 RepID=A0A444UVN9_ACIRT|nr:Transmembrane protein 79 [Acipenser ruthenus]